jgi:hypothetical protein
VSEPYALIAGEDAGALIEFPFTAASADGQYMLHSTLHDNYLVNGVSGFTPGLTQEIVGRMGVSGDGFFNEEARGWLRQIHPLRWVIIHRHALSGLGGPRWATPRLPDDAVTVLSDDEHLVLRLDPVAETGPVVTKVISPEQARLRPLVSLRARLEGGAAGTQGRAISAYVDGVRVASVPARAGLVDLEFRLGDQLSRSRPVRIEIAPAYELRESLRRRDRFRIGTTGVGSPVDLEVVAVDRANGLSRIRVNGAPWTANDRQPNLFVAIDAADGSILNQVVFTDPDPPYVARLIAELPQGAIVALALTGVTEVEAMAVPVKRLGVAVGPSFRRPYALIGVKGATEGTAIEHAFRERAALSVGGERLTVHVEDFATAPSR